MPTIDNVHKQEESIMVDRKYNTAPTATTAVELNPQDQARSPGLAVPADPPRAPVRQRNAQFLYRDICTEVVLERNCHLEQGTSEGE
jgi:hypothetical protein